MMFGNRASDIGVRSTRAVAQDIGVRSTLFTVVLHKKVGPDFLAETFRLLKEKKEK
jgi:hypothetical protein